MRILFACFTVFICTCGQKTTQPGPSPNPQPQVTCAAIESADQCNFSTVKNQYCAWNPGTNQCQVVRTCADIPTRAICDSNLPAEFGGCTWQDNKCIKPNPADCDVNKDSAACNALGFCYWNPANGGECDVVKNCSNFDGNPGREEQCDNYNNQGLSCVWSDIGKTCKRITQCADAIKESECAQHQFDQQYCEWNASSKTCSAISSCASANTQTDCQFVADPLQCTWDSQANTCEPLKPKECPDIKGETRCEQYSFTNPKNPAPNLNCQWISSNTCQAITGMCSTITNLSICNLNKGSDGYCYRDSNVCQVANGCSPLDTEAQCAIANQSYGETPVCKWDSAAPKGGACERTVIQTCPQIKDSVACEVSDSPVCQWTGSNCEAIPSTCPLINNTSDCNSQTKHSFDCEWQPASNTCAPINTCSDVKIQADCNATKYPHLNCSWQNGVCQNSTPTSCADVKDSATCATTKFQSGPCFWNGSSCATQTSCSVLSGSTNPTCEASSLACYLNGNTCVKGACALRASLPVCSNFGNNQSDCTGNDCNWQPATSSSCSFGYVQQASCNTNFCTWTNDGPACGSYDYTTCPTSAGCSAVNCNKCMSGSTSFGAQCDIIPGCDSGCKVRQGPVLPYPACLAPNGLETDCTGSTTLGTCSLKSGVGTCSEPNPTRSAVCGAQGNQAICSKKSYCQWGPAGG